MEYFSEVKKFFEQHRFQPPCGCSTLEIDEFEKIVGFKLPKAYKAYLALMGKDYKGVMRGTDCFIDHAIENTKYLPELLAENNVRFNLAENYLAFFCHQGYIIAWLNLPKEDENPGYYFYSEGTTDCPVEEKNFAEFISTDIIGNAKIDLELRKYKRWWQFWK